MMPSTLVPLRADVAGLDGPTGPATDAADAGSARLCAQLIHNLRSPLAAIRGQAQLLRDRVADGGTHGATLAEGLQRIEDAAAELAQQVRELADAYRAAAPLTPMMVPMRGSRGSLSEPSGLLSLSSVLEADSVVRAVQAGAIRYLLHETSAQDAWQVIKAAVAGQVQLPPGPAAQLAPDVLSLGRLSQRELDVLRLLARGRSNKRIARDLTIGENTVKTHVSSILGKLGVESRTQAALYARRNGLVPPDERAAA